MKTRTFVIVVSFVFVVTIFFVISSCSTNGDPAYVGIWAVYNAEVEPEVFIDAVITLRNDGTFESLVYQAGTTTLTEGSAKGTYVVEGDIFTMTITELYQSGAWQSASQTNIGQYSISGNTMTLNIDVSEPPDGIYDMQMILTKQS